jgi:hypothetical protein
MINNPIEQPVELGVTEEVSAVQRGAEATALTVEVTPINEAIRIAAGALAIKAGFDPEGVAAVYGGTTLIIESAASFAGASWLTTEKSKKTIDWFNSKLEQRGIPSDITLNTPLKAAVAFFGGSAISQAVKYRENTDINKQELRTYGLKASAMLAGTCALQGYGVAAGIETPTPTNIGLSLAAVGSVVGVYKWSKRRLGRSKSDTVKNKEKDMINED